MTLAAAWERYDTRSENWGTIDAPAEIANACQQRIGHRKLPVFSDLINAPTLQADGSLLSSPGHDPATGLRLDLGGLAVSQVPSGTRSANTAIIQPIDDQRRRLMGSLGQHCARDPHWPRAGLGASAGPFATTMPEALD